MALSERLRDFTAGEVGETGRRSVSVGEIAPRELLFLEIMDVLSPGRAEGWAKTWIVALVDRRFKSLDKSECG